MLINFLSIVCDFRVGQDMTGADLSLLAIIVVVAVQLVQTFLQWLYE
jgi:hypothetical protein